MGISLEVYRYRIGCFASVVGHGHAVGPAADLTSTRCGQAKSGKVSCLLWLWRSVLDGLQPSKGVACWLLILVMVAILTLRCGDVHPHPGPVTRGASKSHDATPSASYSASGYLCSGCGKGPFRRMDVHQRSCKFSLSTPCHLPGAETDRTTTSVYPGHVMADQYGSWRDRDAASTDIRCPVCQSLFSNNNSMWQHVNLEHISRQFFPPVSVLKEHGRRLCASCGFSYSSHWQVC